MYIDGLNREVTTKISFTHDDFVSYIESGDTVDNFIGGVEVDIIKLNHKVPSDFISAMTPDEDDPEDTRTKYWKEYCLYKKSLNGTKALFTIGYRDSNGNRKDHVKHDELMQWIDYFGLDNILTKSQFLEKSASVEYVAPE